VAEQDIHVKVEFDTSQATTALKGVSQAAGETAKQTEKVGEAAKKSQANIGQFGSALGLAGQAVGKLNPALGGLVTMAGSATGVIQGLRTAGLGPLGLALSAVSIAVSAGTALWQNYADEQKKAARSIKVEILPTLEDLISKAQRAQVALSLAGRVGQGFGSAAEQAGFVSEADAYVTQVRQKIARLQATGPEDVTGIAERIQAQTRFNDELRRLQVEQLRAEEVARYRRGLQQQAAREQEAIQAEEILDFQEEIADRNRQLQEDADKRNRTARVQAVRETTAALVDVYAEQRAAIAEQIQRDIEWNEQTMADEADVRARMRQQEIDESNAAKDRSIEVAAEQRDILKALQDEQAALLQESTDAVFSALETAMQSSVDAMLDGSKSIGEAMQDMVKQIAKSLASEAIVQGLKQTALGISALAVGSPTAVGHFAAAGKWAAVGVAAGVVGAASGAFGGGGGGGGPAAATGGPALTAGAREGAGTTVVINWGSSGLVYAADRAQLGRDISGMISEAHGRLGRGM
jgi:hypothetical protein